MRLAQYRRGTRWFREWFSKLLLIAAVGVLCLWMASGARAAAIQVLDVKSEQGQNQGDGEVIKIFFSQAVTSEQISAEFQRNFLQLSLRGVSAFPAKNSTVPGGEVEKVFIYQYQPDLARARVLFKHDANQIKSKVRWSIKENSIEVHISGSNDQVAKVQTDNIKNVAASAVRLPAEIKKTKANTKTASVVETAALTSEATSTDDAELIRKILNDDNTKTSAPAPAAAAAPAASAPEELTFLKSSTKETVKEKANPVNPIRKMLTGLLTVLSLMAAIAYAFKRFVLKGKVGLGRNAGMIQMVSSYMLSPKKSIAVVRVGQQLMVLGITDDNISLIQNLGSDANIEKYLDDMPSPGPGFDVVFAKKLEAPGENTTTLEPATKISVRSLIKQKIEGFKPL